MLLLLVSSLFLGSSGEEVLFARTFDFLLTTMVGLLGPIYVLEANPTAGLVLPEVSLSVSSSGVLSSYWMLSTAIFFFSTRAGFELWFLNVLLAKAYSDLS